MDEAHKYMDGKSSDGLSRSIVDGARLMRHDGIRMLVSTQSPHVLAPELLELVSVAVIHRFHSMDWFTYLTTKIPLPADSFKKIQHLQPGEALVFAPQQNIQRGSAFIIKIRPRLTKDKGISRRNELSATSLPSPAKKTIVTTAAAQPSKAEAKVQGSVKKEKEKVVEKEKKKKDAKGKGKAKGKPTILPTATRSLCLAGTSTLMDCIRDAPKDSGFALAAQVGALFIKRTGCKMGDALKEAVKSGRVELKTTHPFSLRIVGSP
jgi:hypothetical protein